MISRPRATYGLACAVNFDWSWCPASAFEREPDLRVVLGDLGEYAGCAERDYHPYARRTSDDPGRSIVISVDRARDGHLRVRYVDGAEFVIDETASRIFGVSRGDLTLEDLVFYLQGPILGFVQRLRGAMCLHASAAVVNGAALAVVGHAGMGKSTSAAVFARRGLPVLTDDVLALRDNGTHFHVQPGLPRVLLWSESVAALWGDPEALPRIVATWEKRYLDLNQPGYHFAPEAVPLGAIYVLHDRSGDARETEITPIGGTHALVELVANTYANDLLDKRQRVQELEVLGRVVNHVPIRKVRSPDDRRAVEHVCEAMIDDFVALHGR
jgi:hypothetical protein